METVLMVEDEKMSRQRYCKVLGEIPNQGYMNTGTGVLLPVHTSYDVVYYSWQF